MPELDVRVKPLSVYEATVQFGFEGITSPTHGKPPRRQKLSSLGYSPRAGRRRDECSAQPHNHAEVIHTTMSSQPRICEARSMFRGLSIVTENRREMNDRSVSRPRDRGQNSELRSYFSHKVTMPRCSVRDHAAGSPTDRSFHDGFR